MGSWSTLQKSSQVNTGGTETSDSQRDKGGHWKPLKRELFLPVQINPALCLECGHCQEACPRGAITFDKHRRVVDYTKCIGCLACQKVCPRNAITVTSVEVEGTFQITVNDDRCTPGCTICVEKCPQKIYSRMDSEKKVDIDPKKLESCRVCRTCEKNCPTSAISINAYVT